MTKPSFIRKVVESVAEIKKMKVDEVADEIAANFESFFNIKLR
jgi:Tat protein secretion system quality control protein TatD with DNase activity